MRGWCFQFNFVVVALHSPKLICKSERKRIKSSVGMSGIKKKIASQAVCLRGRVVYIYMVEGYKLVFWEMSWNKRNEREADYDEESQGILERKKKIIMKQPTKKSPQQLRSSKKNYIILLKVKLLIFIGFKKRERERRKK